jgi:hypothetical protein
MVVSLVLPIMPEHATVTALDKGHWPPYSAHRSPGPNYSSMLQAPILDQTTPTEYTVLLRLFIHRQDGIATMGNE